ncbi:MAG: hypothetical protein WC211_00675 [Dehalococcoidia bacterium]
MTAPLSAAQILRAAAEIVERPGAWIQGVAARDVDGVCVGLVRDIRTLGVCFCAQGAMWAVTGDAEAAGDAEEALRKAIPASTPGGYRSIALWNDTPGRTADEVATAMRRAADTLDPPHRSDACATGGDPCVATCCMPTAKDDEAAT